MTLVNSLFEIFTKKLEIMHKFEKRVLLPEGLNPIKSLKEYKEIGGLKGLRKARSMSPQELIDLVKLANLRGRGGAGFPMAIKWQTVKDDSCPIKYVVCNFAEGEPGTYKDRYLISKNPYWVFEGMLIASHVVGAKQTIIGTKEKFKNVVKILEGVIAEYEAEGVCEKGFIRLVQGPDSYLFGEEKALIEVIDGNGAMPRNIPPFIKGVNAVPPNLNPTVVNNVESMSRLPQIVTSGAEWFKSMGTEDTPGTVILSLSGDLKTPGMYEVEPGLTVREMLFDLGGGPVGDKPIKAVFSGVANRVLTPDQFDLVVDFGTLRADGVGLGSGGFMVYDESRCMVDVARMFSQFLAYSSC
ncbi:NADH-ubiquinone oxidoreductase chain F, partial [hydrothermal vent metagenome]